MITLNRMIHPKNLKDKEGNVKVPSELYYRDTEFQWNWEIGFLTRFAIISSVIIVFGEGINRNVASNRPDYRTAPAIEFYPDLLIACVSVGSEVNDLGMIFNGKVKSKLQDKYLYTHYLDYNKLLMVPLYPIRELLFKKRVLKFCEAQLTAFDHLPRVVNRDTCEVEKTINKKFNNFGERLASQLGQLITPKNKAEISNKLENDWRKWLMADKLFLSHLSYKCYPNKFNKEDRVKVKFIKVDQEIIVDHGKRQFFMLDLMLSQMSNNQGTNVLIEEVRK
jgi:hypothetical protein